MFKVGDKIITRKEWVYYNKEEEGVIIKVHGSNHVYGYSVVLNCLSTLEPCLYNEDELEFRTVKYIEI